MLGLRDNATLAVTKLRSRRIRLIITLVVSGLLFAVLIAGSLILRGVFGSLDEFTKDGFSARFLVSAYGGGDDSALRDEKVVARAKELEAARIAKKTAEAKRLGIAYDAVQDSQLSADGSKDFKQGLNISNPSAQQAVKELGATPALGEAVRKAAQKYGLKGVYRGRHFMQMDPTNSYRMAAIAGGKEIAPAEFTGPSNNPLAVFSSQSQTLDNTLLAPFVLEGLNTDAKPGDPVPILAPTGAAETLLGLKALPAKATSKQKLDAETAFPTTTSRL